MSKSLSNIDDGYGGKSLLLYDSTNNASNTNNISSINDISTYLAGLQSSTAISVPTVNSVTNITNITNNTTINAGSTTTDTLTVNGLAYLNGGFVSTIGTLTNSLVVANITVKNNTIIGSNIINMSAANGINIDSTLLTLTSPDTLSISSYNNLSLTSISGNIDLSANNIDLSANTINLNSSNLILSGSIQFVINDLNISTNGDIVFDSGNILYLLSSNKINIDVSNNFQLKSVNDILLESKNNNINILSDIGDIDLSANNINIYSNNNFNINTNNSGTIKLFNNGNSVIDISANIINFSSNKFIGLPTSPQSTNSIEAFGSLILMSNNSILIDSSGVLNMYSNGVTTIIHYPIPIHKTSIFDSSMDIVYSSKITDEWADKIVSLPIHPFLTTEEVDLIISSVNNF